MRYILLIGSLLLEGITCLYAQNAQDGYMGGIGAGTYVGGIGGGLGMGYVSGTVGSAPAPPACTAPNGQLDFSFCSDAVYYMTGTL